MLTIELIPKTSFFKNLRSELKAAQWDSLRKSVYQKANYRCQICGGKGKAHSVECHEIWEYDHPYQILIELIALCPSCHMVKHWGLTQLRGKEHVAFAHIQKVNNWTPQQVREHISEVAEIWHERNKVNWILNIEAIQA